MLVIDQSTCRQCGGCVPLCSEDALLLLFDNLDLEPDLCNLCNLCVEFCPVSAIREEKTIAV